MKYKKILDPHESLVLDKIIKNNGLSRAKLSQETKLSKASISSIATKLLEKKLIIESGIEKGSHKGGPKPITLSFNHSAGCCLSIEIGNHKLIGAISYLNGEIINYKFEKIKISKQNINIKLTNFIDTLITNIPSTPFGIIGISFGIHGVVNQNRIIFTPYSDLSEIDLKSFIEEKYNITVWIENEANLSALGEQTFSFPTKQLAIISCHSGVGAGIILNNEIYHGHYGQAGEFGHTILYPNGILCPCGNSGCFEQYVSIKAILEKYNKIKKSNKLLLKDFIYGLRINDKDCLDIIRNNALELSIGITNISLLYNPDILILNNPIYREFPEFIELIKKNIHTSFLKPLEIKLDTLGINACIYGGISLALKHFIGVTPSVSLTKNN